MVTSETARNPKIRIGVLALQGDFEAHIKMLADLGVEGKAIRLPEQLDEINGIIIPGGESTAIGKLMVIYGLDKALQQKIHAGIPVWGTCAGLILLAQETDNAMAGQPLLASMHIKVRRNAFGSQRESFETDLFVPTLGEEPFHAFFIRGPSIEAVGPEVEVLATLEDNTIVAVREGNLLGTAFHPEIPGINGQRDSRFHRYFLRMIQNVKA
ncbi:MAG TPA: pyridoxal 5'-phosphate synthase glutaminase subunit PdxT [Ktedonobacteraceae bacterium]|nr:pyridoxal 5'-phosphate synthase glutaminase subunit PdxT [Ktedonobacteraceae bacterium]